MRATEFIEEKRDGKCHSAADIRDFVLSYSREIIPDYQVSAWLMAVYLNGLSDEETFALTDAMVESGDTLDLGSLHSTKVDKHSTGGVGDKVTLAVVPLLAAFGVPIAKMSGRGLGFTGGTLDKLESIPGYNVNLSNDEIVRNVANVGACICAQSPSLVPADKMLYALRDVTGTVESLPLVAASVMSKKIAGGADAIVIDVKVGRGAFMKTLDQGRALAELLVKIGRARGKRVHACLTAMDVPLGTSIGNWLEVFEVAELMQGRGQDVRLRHEIVHLAIHCLRFAGHNPPFDEVLRTLIHGRAFRKFLEIVEAQGGDKHVFHTERQADHIVPVLATENRFVSDIDALLIGRAAMRLGAGRQTKDDAIDPLAGIVLAGSIPYLARPGKPIAFLHTNDASALREAGDLVRAAFSYTNFIGSPPTVLGEVGDCS